MPLLARVAAGKLPFVNVYGTDYPTRDGSGCRDFIHVMDIAAAHVDALRKLQAQESCVRPSMHTTGSVPKENFEIFNLGSETGYTVLEMIYAFQKVSGQEFSFKKVDRRVGDIAMVVAVSCIVLL